jgi:hypothetical protein
VSNEKWVKGTVVIKVSRRDDSGKLQYVPEEVQCIRKGVWAIHEGYKYALTHIPSGAKIKDLITQRAAKQLADELTDPGWNTPEGTMPHFVVLENAKPIIAKYAQYFG